MLLLLFFFKYSHILLIFTLYALVHVFVLVFIFLHFTLFPHVYLCICVLNMFTFLPFLPFVTFHFFNLVTCVTPPFYLFTMCPVLHVWHVRLFLHWYFSFPTFYIICLPFLHGLFLFFHILHVSNLFPFCTVYLVLVLSITF